METGSPPNPDLAGVVSPSPRGTVVDVWVVPGAATTEITGVHGGALRVRVSAPPEGGKANRALEKVLTTVTGARVELVRGPGSRQKRFLVENLEPSEVVRLISKQIG